MIPNVKQIEKLGRNVYPNNNNNSFFRMLGNIVDNARQLLTNFGLRTYRVFVLTVAWSGTEYGQGHSYLKSIREILPTPAVSDLSFIGRFASTAGIHEEGRIIVSEISVNDWTEDELLGINPITGTTNHNERRVWLVTEAAALENDDLAAMASDSLGTPVLNGEPDPVSALDINPMDGGAYKNRNFNTLPKNRAFVSYGAPYLDPKGIQWIIKLDKVEPDFARSGLSIGTT
jgi:hypothetical protein